MASGIFIEAISQLKTAITALGYKPVTDPRNARPRECSVNVTS